MRILILSPDHPEFHLFEEVPNNIYPPDSIFFRQPRRLETDFLHCCFVILKENIAVARAALYFNPQLTFEEKKAAAIGAYECIDDSEVAKMLLSTLSEEAKDRKIEYIIGPMDGSTWNNYRFSLHNDYRNFLLEPFHPVYYNEQFEKSGFEVIATYNSSIQENLIAHHQILEEKMKQFSADGLIFRNIDLDNYALELEKLYPFLTKSFSSNFLYTPISFEAFFRKYSAFGNFIDPRYVILAEDELGIIRGLIFCYIDLFDTDKKTLVVKTIARDSDRRWSGLGMVLGQELIRRAHEGGFDRLIHAFFKNDNASTATSANFNSETYKTYLLYGKTIQSKKIT